MSIVNVTAVHPDGTVYGGAEVAVALVTGSIRPGHVAGTGEIIGTRVLLTPVDGSPLALNLTPSSQIVPEGTHYRVQVDRGRYEWRITVPATGGPFDVGDPTIAATSLAPAVLVPGPTGPTGLTGPAGPVASVAGVAHVAGDVPRAGLVTALALAGSAAADLADDAAVVHKTGAETVAGIKSFSSAPVVPDASFGVAKIDGLNTSLAAKADLVSGTVPAAQLPSFVDDIIESATFAALPATGEAGKLYVVLETGVVYRWSGSAYAEVSASLAIGTTASTAAAGNDARLSDQRTPLDTSVTPAKFAATAVDPVAGTAGARTLGTGAAQALPGNHASTTNARTPTDASVTPAKFAATAVDPAAGTAGARTLGTGATQATAGNDARLSDARTPTAHAATHATAGTDVLTPAAIGAPTVARLDGINPSGQQLLAVSPQPAAPFVTATAPTGISTPSAVLGGVEVRQPVLTSLAVGVDAQRSLTTGANDVAVGRQAQYAITTGGSNVGVGAFAQFALTTGSSNVGVGSSAQQSLTTGGSNLALGTNAQRSVTTGADNVSIGAGTSYSPAGVVANGSVLGFRSTHIGSGSGANDATDPSDTTAIGYRALVSGLGATSIGSGAKAIHAGSVALGMNTTTVAADQVMVGARDIEITVATKGLVLRQPNGVRRRVVVSDTGALSTVAA